MSKKLYFIAALLVGVAGLLSAWFIVSYLPGLIGADVNPNKNIDQLEQTGWVDFTSKTIDGANFTLDTYKGKVVVLGFWASWCAPCLEEFPSQLALANRYPNEMVFVAVSADSGMDEINVFLNNFKSDIGPNTKVIWDETGAISKLYKVGRLPENFIFNKEAKLSRKVVGSINWNSEDAVRFFENLIKKP